MKPLYLLSLIAGAAISLALLLTVKDLAGPASAAPDDPFELFAEAQTANTVSPAVAGHVGAPGRDDAGIALAGGAYLHPPTIRTQPQRVTTRVTYYRYTRQRVGWWGRGPLRRLVSAPFRARRVVRVRCR